LTWVARFSCALLTKAPKSFMNYEARSRSSTIENSELICVEHWWLALLVAGTYGKPRAN